MPASFDFTPAACLPVALRIDYFSGRTSATITVPHIRSGWCRQARGNTGIKSETPRVGPNFRQSLWVLFRCMNARSRQPNHQAFPRMMVTDAPGLLPASRTTAGHPIVWSKAWTWCCMGPSHGIITFSRAICLFCPFTLMEYYDRGRWLVNQHADANQCAYGGLQRKLHTMNQYLMT